MINFVFRSMNKHLLILLTVFIANFCSAQELNCKVDVIVSANTSSINPKIFKTLEKSISDFMNLRRWTDENYAAHQKIDCRLTINILDAGKENGYKAEMTVQSERVVFNSTYSSPIIRHKDASVPFDYIEFQALDYGENNFYSNLTSALAFYANMIIAMDNESFVPKGGSASLDKCQSICTQVPPNYTVNGEIPKGWQTSEAQDIKGQRTRIGMIMASINNSNEAYRLAYYKYHVQGIDLLESDPKKAMDNIEQALTDMYNIPTKHYIHKSFMLTKADEIIHIFSGEIKARKTKIGDILIGIEPTLTNKVSKGLN
jgi:hypothetical protein